MLIKSDGGGTAGRVSVSPTITASPINIDQFVAVNEQQQQQQQQRDASAMRVESAVTSV